MTTTQKTSVSGLSPKQLQIIQAAIEAEDANIKPLALKLGMNHRTLEAHRVRICEKMGVHSFAGAVIRFLKQTTSRDAMVESLVDHVRRFYPVAALLLCGSVVIAQPAGTVQSAPGFSWVIPGTNRVETIEVHNHRGEVMRFDHDRSVYGNSIAIDPGKQPGHGYFHKLDPNDITEWASSLQVLVLRKAPSEDFKAAKSVIYSNDCFTAKTNLKLAGGDWAVFMERGREWMQVSPVLNGWGDRAANFPVPSKGPYNFQLRKLR